MLSLSFSGRFREGWLYSKWRKIGSMTNDGSVVIDFLVIEKMTFGNKNDERRERLKNVARVLTKKYEEFNAH